ncbi:MAG: sigma-70 family RNA polymerase sigma factor [Oscillospiraceae bacterium]|nr:sigma-70 family RNA polymerase sigma factor [Oscillospiraceae bacterium]
MLDSEDDEYLIDEVIKGNVELFTKIVMKYEQYAYKCAIIILKDHHYAKDAVNEAFMRAYRSLRAFRNENFKSYFLKIVYNCCYEILRKNKRLEFKDLNSEEDSLDYTEFDFEKLDDKKIVIKALQNLPLEDKTIIMLKYYYDYDYDKIASFLKIKPATVGSRLFRAKERLKKILREGGVY